MTTIPAGAPTWADIATSDQPRTLAFYSELFGWTHEQPDPGLGGYANFLRDGVRIAGCVPAMPFGQPDVWSVYFATGDAEKTAQLATDHGGTVIAPAMQVADLGSMAVLTDAGGAALGAWQAGSHPGFAVLDEPGAPSWFELHTRAYDRVLQFYRDVLGWQTETVADVPGFRYTCLTYDGEQRAGVMDGSEFLRDGEGGWATYWHCEDMPAMLTRVQQLGGAVTAGPDDTAYGVLTMCTDPTGAQFKLRTPPAS